MLSHHIRSFTAGPFSGASRAPPPVTSTSFRVSPTALPRYPFGGVESTSCLSALVAPEYPFLVPYAVKTSRKGDRRSDMRADESAAGVNDTCSRSELPWMSERSFSIQGRKPSDAMNASSEATEAQTLGKPVSRIQHLDLQVLRSDPHKAMC